MVYIMLCFPTCISFICVDSFDPKLILQWWFGCAYQDVSRIQEPLSRLLRQTDNRESDELLFLLHMEQYHVVIQSLIVVPSVYSAKCIDLLVEKSMWEVSNWTEISLTMLSKIQ